MKIATWNVDGLRAMLSRRRETLLSVLEKLDADIVCFQETKLSKDDLRNVQDFAIVPGWKSFYGLCHVRSGYAGVATYCKKEVLVIAAEEGLSGKGCTESSGIMRPDAAQFASMPEASLKHNDDEGRCMITDHGKFVLVHLYGPAVTDIMAERYPRKILFYRALQLRVEAWQSDGRHVIIVGDLNIASEPRDNCDWADSKLSPAKLTEEFLRDRPDRKWFQEFLAARRGSMTDLFRKFHPVRQKAYTVWGRFGQRERNQGSRVDYILGSDTDQDGISAANVCTSCDILVDWQGSDHAPVIAHFDEAGMTSSSGRVHASGLDLESRMRFLKPPDTQQTISAMFKRKRKREHGPSASDTPPRPGEG